MAEQANTTSTGEAESHFSHFAFDTSGTPLLEYMRADHLALETRFSTASSHDRHVIAASEPAQSGLNNASLTTVISGYTRRLCPALTAELPPELQHASCGFTAFPAALAQMPSSLLDPEHALMNLRSPDRIDDILPGISTPG